MVWGAIAGAAIGAVGSYLGSKSSSKAAKDAGKAQSQADAERLAFDKERYEQWQATYGSVEENLSTYFKQLSPTFRIVQGLQNYEKEKDVAMTNLRENLAQRGLATSGITADVELSTALASAEARAQIRANAPMEVAKEKGAFLTIGLGNNPGDSVSNAYGDRATTAGRTAVATAAAAGRAQAAMWESGANLAEELASAFDTGK